MVPWPSPGLGEEVAAFVTLRQGITTDDLLAYCRERLAPYKVPSIVLHRDTLPKRRSDKIDKPALQSQLPVCEHSA